MATPTPGAWQAHAPNSPTGGWTICAYPSNRVFAVVIHERDMEPGETEANARLMAMAKELRDLLEETAEQLDDEMALPGQAKRIRNLLARADGRTE